ncbi:hypothetical protein LR48_Vigan03g147500 [Vigna angularis]|uniref:Uncharacterized protein n=1 Tax=Phaseolus angularis TaxID=3914 RepID=A0A0L9U5J0_PHAAN|nr:hypothetical protein LR48_Vigan03g147500 [Vigna angularis]
MTFGPLASNLLPRSFGHLRLKQFQHLFSRPFGLKRSANCVSHVRAFVLAAVRSRAFGTSLVINVRSLALGLTTTYVSSVHTVLTFDLTCRSVSTARQSTNTSAPTFGHTHDRPPDVRHLGLNHSTLRPPWPLAIRPPRRSTIRPPERSTFRPFGLICSNIQPRTIGPFDPSDDQPIRLKNVRPLASVQHVTVDGQQKTECSTGYTPSGSCSPKNTQNINRSTNHVHERSTGYTPMGNCSPKNTQYIRDTLPRRSSSQPFGLPLISTARQLMCTSVQAVGRSASLWFRPLDKPCVRAFKQLAVRPQRCSTFAFNRSTISVRAFKQSAVRPPYCFRPLDNLSVDRSASFWFQPLDNLYVRAFKQSAVQPQRCSTFAFNRLTIPLYERSSSRPFGLFIVFNRSTIPVYEHSSSWPFGLKDVRPSLSTARQSLYEHSSSRPFGLLIVFDRSTISVRAFKQSAVRPPYCFRPLDNLCERTFKQSTVRPPFGFNRSTIPVYEHSSSRPFSLKDVRPLLSTARQSLCTSVQAVGRSASKMFDLCFQPLDNPSVRAFKQSAVRPPYCFRPLDNVCERTFKQSAVRRH